MKKERLQIGEHTVSVCFQKPKSFSKAVILANGAGADMESPFICYFHEELAKRGYCTVKFNFVYQEKGRKSPDGKALLEKTWKEVLEFVKKKTKLGEEQIVLAGKSMGGRIASQIINDTKAKKLVLLGYPLHAPGTPEKMRDEHLYDIKARKLFVSGDRDKLCDPARFKKVLGRLKNAKFHPVPGGDHSLKVPKKSGKTHEDVLAECVSVVAKFIG